MTLKPRLLVACLLCLPVIAKAQALDTSVIDQALGRSGQIIGDMYRVGFQRSDLHVSLQGVEILPGLALGSWAAFSGTGDSAMVMGDLVLLQDEVNPVMEKLRAAGFDITAVHNHLLDETPRVMYMHYMGRGQAVDLARSLRSALSQSGTPLGRPASPSSGTATPPAWVQAIQDALGRTGAFQAGVLSFGVPRAEPVTMEGMTIPPAEGVAESINFQAAGPGKVATTGDFVLTADETNPVIGALEKHGIRITSLHSHMLTEDPRLFFLHFWAVGTPKDVAEGIADALGNVSIGK